MQEKLDGIYRLLMSRYGCSDLLSGLLDCRNFLYTAIASYLISSAFIFTVDTFFVAFFASSSILTHVTSSKSCTFAMFVLMTLKVRPLDVVALFSTSFSISDSLLEITTGRSFQTRSQYQGSLY